MVFCPQADAFAKVHLFACMYLKHNWNMTILQERDNGEGTVIPIRHQQVTH